MVCGMCLNLPWNMMRSEYWSTIIVWKLHNSIHSIIKSTRKNGNSSNFLNKFIIITVITIINATFLFNSRRFYVVDPRHLDFHHTFQGEFWFLNFSHGWIITSSSICSHCIWFEEIHLQGTPRSYSRHPSTLQNVCSVG